jgi:putative transcriptional regulator
MISVKENMLLIADPFLKDEHFKRSVIYLCSHSSEGSVGFALNRLFEYSLNQLISGIDHCNIPVYIGGPVELDSIHFIHQYPLLIPDSQQVSETTFWGGDLDFAKELIARNELNLKKIKFFIGYSGWGADQLNDELKEKSWLLSQPNDSIIFNTSPELVWKESILQMGPDYKDLVNYPLDPQLN